MSVDDVSKASGMCGRAWDPIKHITSSDCSFRLTATPQEGYCFPQYLEHAGPGTYRLGALYSRPYDLDAFISVPELDERIIALICGQRTFSESHGKCPEVPCLRSDTRRVFRFQRFEQHSALTTELHFEHMIKSVRGNLSRRFGRPTTAVYVLTSFRIADGLEVSDGEFYRKFDGRVILSYRMHRITINRHGGLVPELVDPQATR